MITKPPFSVRDVREGAPRTKKCQKIDFFKSIQTLSPMSWVFRDRLGGLVSPLKRFYDNFRFHRKNRENGKKSTFLALEGVNLQNWSKKSQKIDFFQKCLKFITNVVGV